MKWWQVKLFEKNKIDILPVCVYTIRSAEGSQNEMGQKMRSDTPSKIKHVYQSYFCNTINCHAHISFWVAVFEDHPSSDEYVKKDAINTVNCTFGWWYDEDKDAVYCPSHFRIRHDDDGNREFLGVPTADRASTETCRCCGATRIRRRITYPESWHKRLSRFAAHPPAGALLPPEERNKLHKQLSKRDPFGVTTYAKV